MRYRPRDGGEKINENEFRYTLNVAVVENKCDEDTKCILYAYFHELTDFQREVVESQCIRIINQVERIGAVGALEICYKTGWFQNGKKVRRMWQAE